MQSFLFLTWYQGVRRSPVGASRFCADTHNPFKRFSTVRSPVSGDRSASGQDEGASSSEPAPKIFPAAEINLQNDGQGAMLKEAPSEPPITVFGQDVSETSSELNHEEPYSGNLAIAISLPKSGEIPISKECHAVPVACQVVAAVMISSIAPNPVAYGQGVFRILEVDGAFSKVFDPGGHYHGVSLTHSGSSRVLILNRTSFSTRLGFFQPGMQHALNFLMTILHAVERHVSAGANIVQAEVSFNNIGPVSVADIVGLGIQCLSHVADHLDFQEQTCNNSLQQVSSGYGCFLRYSDLHQLLAMILPHHPSSVYIAAVCCLYRGSDGAGLVDSQGPTCARGALKQFLNDQDASAAVDQVADAGCCGPGPYAGINENLAAHTPCLCATDLHIKATNYTDALVPYDSAVGNSATVTNVSLLTRAHHKIDDGSVHDMFEDPIARDLSNDPTGDSVHVMIVFISAAHDGGDLADGCFCGHSNVIHQNQGGHFVLIAFLIPLRGSKGDQWNEKAIQWHLLFFNFNHVMQKKNMKTKSLMLLIIKATLDPG